MFFKTVFTAIAILVGTCPACAQENPQALSKLCVIQSNKISESSGVAYSHHYEDAVWTHNDSGGDAVAYLLSTQSGETLMEVNLARAANKDWEDIDSFQYADKNYLLIADVGDNLRRRKTCQLCVFPEPELDLVDQELPQTVNLDDWKDIQFQYEDGPRDCEAVAADLNSNQIILLEKVYAGQKRTPGLYFIELPTEKTREVLTASRAGDLPIKNITAMDISADGNKMVVRTYLHGYIYSKTSEQTWPAALQNAQPQQIALPVQRQGEGVCFTPDGSGVVCSSEFRKSALWLVRLQANESHNKSDNSQDR